MNRNVILHILLWTITLTATACATKHAMDGAINACELTKPPKEAYVTGAGHLGRSFTYPDPKKIPANYSGCVKGWIGDYESPPKTFLVAFIRFNNGLVSYIESFDTDGTIAVVCKFDTKEILIKETLVEKHYAGCMELLPTAREFVNSKELTK